MDKIYLDLPDNTGTCEWCGAEILQGDPRHYGPQNELVCDDCAECCGHVLL